MILVHTKIVRNRIDLNEKTNVPRDYTYDDIIKVAKSSAYVLEFVNGSNRGR